jgi:alpha-L-fucosidase
MQCSFGRRIFLAVIVLYLIAAAALAQQNQQAGLAPPKPFGPVPHPRQIAWHEMEFYAFVHFTVNTFTDKEWGYGDEDPAIFNPTELDCRQWTQAAKAAGMKGIIITAKHHDGFCLWPSKYTEHSVKNSPWKNGAGDVVGDLAAACKEFNLKLGIYLSPWDRNHPDYGKPEYVTYFKNQLTELLTNYGDIFTVWFDGANGGAGYYGGAREERRIDRQTYYRWPEIHQLVRRLQPNACMFSDAGPDVRWVGNEAGRTGPVNWSRFKRDEFYPGISGKNRQLTQGHPDGDYWVPTEVNTSIRPGWFYHPDQDNRVKTVQQLVDIYYASVGNNGNFLLNLPPDRRGLFHETDVDRLTELGKFIRSTFDKNLAAAAAVTADHTRGNSDRFAAAHVTDDNYHTYWAAKDGVTSGTLEITLDQPQAFNVFKVMEYVPLGQRVENFAVEAFLQDQWREIARGTTIGYRRILRFKAVKSDKIRLRIQKAQACPTIAMVGLYYSGL